MLETAKLIFMCSIFYEGAYTSDGVSVSNDYVNFDKVTIYETGWFNNNSNQGKIKLVSYFTKKLFPQNKWDIEYEYETTYKLSEGGNYYFETYYESIVEDEETLVIDEIKGRIEYALDPDTLKYRLTFYDIKDGVEDKEGITNYGYCIPVYEKEG